MATYYPGGSGRKNTSSAGAKIPYSAGGSSRDNNTHRSSSKSSYSIANSGIKKTQTPPKQDPIKPKQDKQQSPTQVSTTQQTQAPAHNAISDYYDQMRRAYEEEQRRREEAARNAYNSNMSALSNAYNTKANALKSSYDSTLGQLSNAYSNSQDKINADNAKALQEAYINKMLSQKNMQQNMTALGLSGGATESSMASLQNAYGNSRNNIQASTNQNLADLQMNYANNQANALQQYNAQLAAAQDTKYQYESQLANDLANAVASSYSDLYKNYSQVDNSYLNYLMDLEKQQQALAYKQQRATNSNGSGVDTKDELDINGHSKNYNKYMTYAKTILGSATTYGDNEEGVADRLALQGANAQEIADILNQLGRKDK